MKKRFLSAALVLAMVLTLLPLSVMPASAAVGTANPKEGETVYYYAQGTVFPSQVTNANETAPSNGWYCREQAIDNEGKTISGRYTYAGPIDSGIVTSVSNSGTWYSKIGEKVDVPSGDTTKEYIPKPGAFTVLGNSVTINELDWNITDARLNGNTLEITSFAEKAQSIVVKGDATSKGTLNLPNELEGYTFNLTASNATVDGFAVKNKTNTNGTISYGGGTVSLTDCTVSGNISMPKGALTLTRTTGATSISMGVSAYGQGGTVNLNEGSSVTTGVNMYGPSTLNIKDTSNAGGVTLFGGGKGDVPTNVGKAADQQINPNWSGVTVNLSQSGTATSIKHASKSMGVNGTATSEAADLTTHTIKGETRGNIGTTGIELNYANVNLNGAGAGAIKVKVGNVTLSNSATAELITLGDSEKKIVGKCTLDISGGGTVVKGEVKTTDVAATNLTVRISGGDISSVNLGPDYKAGGITGGTFGSAVTNSAWLSNVTYQIKWNSSGKFTYTNSFAEAVSAYTDSSSNEIAIVGTDTGSSNKNCKTITFQVDDNKTVFVLKANTNTRILLPTVIGTRSVSKWYIGNTPLTAGGYYPVTDDVTLKATSTEADLGTINGVSATVTTDAAGETPASNPNLTAELVGNTIRLSGAVDMKSNNYAPIKLVFTTTTSEAKDADNLTVMATYYDSNPKSVLFTGTVGNGLEVSNDYKEVGLKGSNTRFTVDCSGLRKLQNVVMDSDAGNGEQVVTVSGTNLGIKEKEQLIAALKTITFDYANSPAMKQAINKALASYTESGVNSAINTGRQAYARDKYKNTNTATMNLSDVQAYNTLKLQVYLDIRVTNVTNYGSGTSGSITLDITPKYHEMVYSGTTAAPNPVSKSLDAALLKSTDGKVTINLPTDWGMTIFASGSPLYAHHGDYVYKVDSTGSTPSFVNLHGFSTFVINTVAPVAEVNGIVRNGAFEGKTTTETGDFTYYYDTLAAAVADVANGGTVKVSPGYKGTTSIPVNGSARQFTVDNKANAGTALTFTGANVVSNGANDTYTVELTRDTVAARGNVVVSNVTGGTASATPNPATVGQTVTITLTAQTGYVANGVTVVTANGQAVSVSGSGTTYTFVMPAGNVTVTPTFVLGDGKASFEYNTNANQGSVQAITGTTDGRVEQGTVVPVAVSPRSGYRTIGLTARGNNGASAVVTRTGLNSFNVTVPAGASVVTLTPAFDLDTNTPFADVLSSHWASKYVTWTYQTKYFEGTGTYTFGPANYITRGEVVAALWKADGKQIVNYPNPFKDVPTNYWAYDAVMWAASKGLIDTSTGYFAPMGYASRAEVVTILYKRANSPAVYGTSGFADVASNATYAKAVTWARQNKLTNGYGGNTYFRPAYAISRAEVAAFLSRAFGGPA